MALTSFESFLARAENQAVITGDDFTVGIAKDRSLTDAFKDGALQGAEGMSADIEYFSALFNTLKGDDEAVADNIASARQYEQNAAGATKGMENFEQFLDEPTIEAR